MKKKYNTEVLGVITDIKLRGHDFPKVITVQYEVEGKKYEIKENQVMKKIRAIKLGFIPIGYKTKSLIEIKSGTPVLVGNKVRVLYNCDNPSQAILPDNDSKTTWL